MKRTRIAGIVILALIPLWAAVGVGAARFATPSFSAYVPLVAVFGDEEPRGVGATYNSNGDYDRCTALRELGMGWYYNWGNDPGICPGVESVPWIWCTAIPTNLGGNSIWTGFGNEAENPDQCGKTPTQMADAYALALQRHPGRKWVAPNSFSIEWIEQWLPILQQRGLDMPDALGVHCYEDTSCFDGDVYKGCCQGHFERAMRLARQYGIGEVWVTEWAYVPMPGENLNRAVIAMNEMIDYFEGQPTITRYAWFQLSYLGTEDWAFKDRQNTSLVNFFSGEIGVLGEAYRLTQPEPTPTPAPDYGDPRADVTGDKEVNILDLSIVGSNFGKKIR